MEHSAFSKKPLIAVVGRKEDTVRYENTLKRLSVPYITTLSFSHMQSCDGLLLPGGGDITPAFFGQKNAGSLNIDTELDIIQIQALEQAVRYKKPVLGICKGMQIINVFFGGTIVQHMKEADIHRYENGDKFHETVILSNTYLHRIYGSRLMVNSAHHQKIDKLGNDLSAVQFTPDFAVMEGLCHKELPIFGVQWHPERLPVDGDALFFFWLSLFRSSGCGRCHPL